MPRVLSLSARTAFNAAETEEVSVTLATIRHPDLESPIYLSSDPTQILSLEPLRYGTVSKGIEYEFVLMAAALPDDSEDDPPSTQIVFENVVADMVAVVRSVSTPSEIDLATVLASAPDDIEDSYVGLEAVRASYDQSRVALDISREGMVGKMWPAHRTTKARFPGLYR